MRRFARFAVAVLVFNVGVIVWGAFVRASGSGAGCGSHWPLCNGEVVPRGAKVATLVEFSHRASSGMAMVLVYLLAFFAFRLYPRGHHIRKSTSWAAVLVSFEAVIGAGLVLFELVAHNASAKRALSVGLHLTNTLFLLGALALTAFWAAGGAPVSWRGKRLLVGLAVAPLAGMLLVGVTGAVAALGDTLFPARTLAEGLAEDLSGKGHLFVRLRGLHPPIALGTAIVALIAAAMLRDLREAARVRVWSQVAMGLVVLQVVAGLANLALLAPVWMQLVHLVLADAVWIALVLMGASALEEEPLRVEAGGLEVSRA
jgi:cytochrome c oxidase assembly protein subunit 15